MGADNRETIVLKNEGKTNNDIVRLMTELSAEQIAQAEDFARTIDVTDRMAVLKYGNASRQKTSRFAESSLLSLPANDLNEIREDIRKLLKKQKEFIAAFEKSDQLNGYTKESYASFRSLYDKFSNALGECSRRLEIHCSSLHRHIDRMEGLYENCMNIIREFDMYIYAGMACLKENRESKLPQMALLAERSGLLEDSLKAEDFKNANDAFEKQIHDLSISRSIPLQTMTQIRLIQKTDELIAESLETLRMDTFALYRNRVILSLGLQKTDKENEKIIDPDLFLQANNDLSAALNAVLKTESSQKEKQKQGLFRK